jgi:hypothetical protein
LGENAVANDLHDMEQHLAEMQRRLDAFLEILERFLIETRSSGAPALARDDGELVSAK